MIFSELASGKDSWVYIVRTRPHEGLKVSKILLPKARGPPLQKEKEIMSDKFLGWVLADVSYGTGQKSK